MSWAIVRKEALISILDMALPYSELVDLRELEGEPLHSHSLL